jgi:hypothetical protein
MKSAGESGSISTYGLVESFRLDAVENGQIRVEQNSLVSECANGIRDRVGRTCLVAMSIARAIAIPTADTPRMARYPTAHG